MKFEIKGALAWLIIINLVALTIILIRIALSI